MDSLWAYLNGDWIPASELRIGVDDVGFLLGVTVTERLRTFGGQVFRLEEHVERLQRSLEIIGLDAIAIADEIARTVPEFVHRNRARIAADDDWSIIAFATPGITGRSRPTVCVHGFPLPFQLWAQQYEAGVSVVVSDVRQVPENCWPPELKCRSRMHFYLADRQATAKWPGARAILLDQQGFIAEASTANLLVYREGEGLISPPLEHILSGVSLNVMAALARQLEINFLKRPLAVDELRSADEAMLASTSICVLPVTECDGTPLATGQPGPIYRRLLAAWCDLVGVDVAAQAQRYASRSL